MAITIIINNINESVEIGDIVYSVPTTYSSPSGAIDSFIEGNFPNIVEVGEVISFASGLVPSPWNGITIDNTASGVVPNIGDFLMFSKDKGANTSGLLGYYMDIDFENNSKYPIELFQVGTIAETSSK